MKFRYAKKYRKGFTLIELLVVISIVSLVSSVVLASLNSSRQKAKIAKFLSEINSLRTALYLFYDKKGIFPGNDQSYPNPSNYLINTMILGSIVPKQSWYPGGGMGGAYDLTTTPLNVTDKLTQELALYMPRLPEGLSTTENTAIFYRTGFALNTNQIAGERVGLMYCGIENKNAGNYAKNYIIYFDYNNISVSQLKKLYVGIYSGGYSIMETPYYCIAD